MATNKSKLNPTPYVNKNLEVLHRKFEDYGSENIHMTGVQGLLTRIQDKVSRAANLASGSTPNFEGIEETFLDLANYGLIGQMLVGGDFPRDASPKVIYLAGSIDNTLGEDVVSWKARLFLELTQEGWSVYDPAKAFGASFARSPEANKVISTINRAALATCSHVVANIGVGKCFGTIREIEYAVNTLHKPVLVFGYNLKEHVEAWDIDSYNTIEDVIKALSDGTTRNFTVEQG